MKQPEPIRTILVDDHAMVRAGIRRFLEKDPAIEIIAEAESAAKAHQLLALHDVDVALVDIKMPETNGIELTRQLRVMYPQLGILVVSAFDDEPFVKAAIRAGANGYVLKSAEPLQLIRAVHAVNEGRSAIDPELAPLLMQMALGSNLNLPAVQLTEREVEVLRLAAEGKTNKEVGASLKISDRTVQSHLARVFRKLDVNTRTEAVKIGISLGLISAD